jgi:hypothetical protein
MTNPNPQLNESPLYTDIENLSPDIQRNVVDAQNFLIDLLGLDANFFTNANEVLPLRIRFGNVDGWASAGIRIVDNNFAELQLTKYTELNFYTEELFHYVHFVLNERARKESVRLQELADKEEEMRGLGINEYTALINFGVQSQDSAHIDAVLKRFNLMSENTLGVNEKVKYMMEQLNARLVGTEGKSMYLELLNELDLGRLKNITSRLVMESERPDYRVHIQGLWNDNLSIEEARRKARAVIDAYYTDGIVISDEMKKEILRELKTKILRDRAKVMADNIVHAYLLLDWDFPDSSTAEGNALLRRQLGDGEYLNSAARILIEHQPGVQSVLDHSDNEAVANSNELIDGAELGVAVKDKRNYWEHSFDITSDTFTTSAKKHRESLRSRMPGLTPEQEDAQLLKESLEFMQITRDAAASRNWMDMMLEPIAKSGSAVFMRKHGGWADFRPQFPLSYSTAIQGMDSEAIIEWMGQENNKRKMSILLEATSLEEQQRILRT